MESYLKALGYLVTCVYAALTLPLPDRVSGRARCCSTQWRIAALDSEYGSALTMQTPAQGLKVGNGAGRPGEGRVRGWLPFCRKVPWGF